MNKKALLKHILSLAIFGSNGVLAAHISLSSYETVFVRTVLASFMMLAIFKLSKNSFTFGENPRELLFISVSGIAMGVEWMFLYEAYRQIGVGAASLMNYTGPAIVLILSPFIFKEKLTWAKILAFLAVACGMLCLNGATIAEGGTRWGLFCGGMSAVCYAFMVIFNKKAARITGVENTVLQLFAALAAVTAFFFFKNGFSLPAEASDWPWLLCLGVINTGLACYLYFSTFIDLPAQTISICGYIEPLCSVVFGAIFLAQKLSAAQSAGAALILGGAVFGTLQKENSK